MKVVIRTSFNKPIFYSFFVLDNNLNAVVPLATWAKDSVRAPNIYDGILGAPASTIHIIGNMSQLQFLGGVPTYGRMVIDLPSLSTDVSLSLPNGSKIRGNLEILNTNNHTLTLLAGTSSTSSVLVTVGTNEAGASFGGALIISGTSTKVALARATAAAPATSYKLLVNKGFSQAGGNFSLQDYDNATGSSILAIKNDFIQTGRSFITNSTSVSPFASFVLVMDDPNCIVGPSGGFFSSRILNLSSGTIDNDRHMVTLRIDHSVYSNKGFESLQNGVLLQSPLEVGRLELVRSPLTTTALNVITVTDPSPKAITIGTTGRSYVNGPLRRITNATQPYVFPTGKGNNSAAIFIFDSCVVMPASATSSLYQAEYFKTGYADRSVTLPLKGVSRSDYWDVSRISGSDAQVKLTLRAAIVGAVATDGLVVAHFENSDWIAQNGWVLTPGTSTAGSVTLKLLSGFGAFTIGYLNPTTLPAIVPGGLSYKYYEGVFDVLPDFSTLTPIKSGVSENVNLAVRPAGVNDDFAFVWEGNINIPTAGTYTFETVSDDGSKVYFNTPYSVNGTSLVNNDGLHAPVSATGTITIPAAGLYPISMTFFEKDGGETMQVYWTGPGISRQLIPDIAFTSSNSAAINTSAVVLNNQRTTSVNAEPLNVEKQSTEIRKIYPNPFVESFTIDYYNSNSIGHNVSIGIYDLKGMLLYTYQPGNLAAGYNKFTINLGGRNLAQGVYIAQLKINGIPASSVKLIKANR